MINEQLGILEDLKEFICKHFDEFIYEKKRFTDHEIFTSKYFTIEKIKLTDIDCVYSYFINKERIEPRIGSRIFSFIEKDAKERQEKAEDLKKQIIRKEREKTTCSFLQTLLRKIT